jgi:GTP-binding protein EngB required for normal cell division
MFRKSKVYKKDRCNSLLEEYILKKRNLFVRIIVKDRRKTIKLQDPVYFNFL